MGQRRRPDKPVRRWVEMWGLLLAVTAVWAVSAPGVTPASRDTFTAGLLVTYVLGGVGQLACIWALWTSMNRWEPSTDDDHRLRVLTGQASLTMLVGFIANSMWGAQVVGLPVVIGLVAVATMRDGAEALLLAMKVRNRYYDRLNRRAARHAGRTGTNAPQRRDPAPKPRLRLRLPWTWS